MRLQDITPNVALTGLEPSFVVTVLFANPIGENSLQVFYKLPDGGLRERLLTRADEDAIALATAERPWSFDGDPADFLLAVEAKRIDLAFLFDPMMAVHTSNVEPLPHQITAVYESMLPRQPLRFVLADDPGAGKTIMAGLYIRELIMRADARRILIVAPGSLVEQWRDELYSRSSGLSFTIYVTEMDGASPTGNPFRRPRPADRPSRPAGAQTEDLQDKICARRLGPGGLRRGAQAVGPLFRLRRLEKTRRFCVGRKARRAHPPPPADDGHAAQRQGGGLPAFPLAARFRPLLRQVPRRRAQGRYVRPHAPHGQGGTGQVRRHAPLSRAPRLHGQLHALAARSRSSTRR